MAKSYRKVNMNNAGNSDNSAEKEAKKQGKDARDAKRQKDKEHRERLQQSGQERTASKKYEGTHAKDRREDLEKTIEAMRQQELTGEDGEEEQTRGDRYHEKKSPAQKVSDRKIKKEQERTAQESKWSGNIQDKEKIRRDLNSQSTMESREKPKEIEGQIEKGTEKANKAVDTAKKAKNIGAFLKANLSGGCIGALSGVLVFIVLLILFIGLASFIMNMPDAVIEEMNKALSNWSWKSIDSAVNTPIDESIAEKQIVGLANYLEGMGYDLIGYGFVDEISVDDNAEITERPPSRYYHILAYKGETRYIPISRWFR